MTKELAEVIRGLPGVHLPSLYIAAAAVGCILLSARFAPKLHASLIVVVGAIAASAEIVNTKPSLDIDSFPFAPFSTQNG